MDKWMDKNAAPQEDLRTLTWSVLCRRLGSRSCATGRPLRQKCNHRSDESRWSAHARRRVPGVPLFQCKAGAGMLIGAQRGLLDRQLDEVEVLHTLVRVLCRTYEAHWCSVHER